MAGTIWASLNADRRKPVERIKLKVEVRGVIGAGEVPEEAWGQGIQNQEEECPWYYDRAEKGEKKARKGFIAGRQKFLCNGLFLVLWSGWEDHPLQGGTTREGFRSIVKVCKSSSGERGGGGQGGGEGFAQLTSGNHPLLWVACIVFWSRSQQPSWSMVGWVDRRCRGLNCIPVNSRVETLIPRTSNCDLIWK